MADQSVMNRTKFLLRQGKTAVGTMASELQGAALPRLLAAAGFDFVIFDAEHGVYSTETVADMCAVARLAGITPIVRIPEIRKESVSRTLDLGALGLLVPQVKTADEARQVVRWAKYAPQGERGVALGRAHTDYGKGTASSWMARLNEETMVIVQVETKEAVDNLSDIASVEGVDALFVGPADLSSALGVPGDMDHPKMADAIAAVLSVCAMKSVTPGIHLHDAALAKTWNRHGMRLLTLYSDIGMVLAQGSQAVQALRGANRPNA